MVGDHAIERKGVAKKRRIGKTKVLFNKDSEIARKIARKKKGTGQQRRQIEANRDRAEMAQ